MWQKLFKKLFKSTRARTDATSAHDIPAEYAEVPPEIRQQFTSLQDSAYWRHLEPLKTLVVNRIVHASTAGHSGFTLFLDDGSWILSYLENGELRWIRGTDQPSEEQQRLMHSAGYGDGTAPLAVALPYAEERCDLAAELAHAHGQRVTDVTFGENCFNFCFPNGHELETMLVPTQEGKTALRIFWEQW